MVEYISCQSVPAVPWSLLPATGLASRKILSDKNIKNRTGPSLCVLRGPDSSLVHARIQMRRSHPPIRTQTLIFLSCFTYQRKIDYNGTIEANITSVTTGDQSLNSFIFIMFIRLE
jgi:hypothetical protein